MICIEQVQGIRGLEGLNIFMWQIYDFSTFSYYYKSLTNEGENS